MDLYFSSGYSLVHWYGEQYDIALFIHLLDVKI